jgi:hypothetical protein
MDQSPATPTRRAARRPRIRGLAIGLGLLLAAASAGTVQAGHVAASLVCGSETYEVDGTQPLPAGFEAPVPWSGLFLLEGTTTVFRALSIERQGFPFSRPKADKFPGDVIECKLWSEGFGFPEEPNNYWAMTGVFIP